MFDCSDKYFVPVLHRTNGSLLNVQKEQINAENIVDTIKKYDIKDIDLLSIDIDGIDYWVLKNLINDYKPKVLVLEYNSQLGPETSIAVKYDPNFVWDWTYYQGASLMAFVNMLTDYTLVYCEKTGINCFFVRTDLIKDHFGVKSPKELFMPCNFACGPIFGNPEGVCGHRTVIKKPDGVWVDV
jgi:hypothetical protein